MKKATLATILVVALAAQGCGFGAGGGTTATAVVGEAAAVDSPRPATPLPELDPEDPSLLPRPFTPEQIRDEWVEGFTLTWTLRSPEGEQRQRWTVLAADPEGAEIELADLDPVGQVVGQPTRSRSTWVELRDHANFRADLGRRTAVVEDSPLGELAGWRYTVRDEDDGTVKELFFAESLPGAPVRMRVTRDGEEILAMTQLERRRP